MQVVSTFLPDIKSQKISEHRFRLIGPSVAQEPTQIHSRQTETSVDQTRQPRTTHQRKLGAVAASGRPVDHPGRPSWPVGPTALTNTRVVSWLVL